VAPTILVVDDDAQVREVTGRYLADVGLDSLAVGSAGEALTLLADGRAPDLLVLDIKLPDLSGPELAQRIHLRFPRVPVLFLSAWPEAEVGPRALQPVLWRFLPKPFSQGDFIEAVRRLLGFGSQMAVMMLV
jgi:CheY-like chemotaxis protein